MSLVDTVYTYHLPSELSPVLPMCMSFSHSKANWKLDEKSRTQAQFSDKPSFGPDVRKEN